MSLHTASWVICDVCYEAASADFSDETPRDARYTAKALGFVRRRRDGMLWDLCPECQSEPEGET